VREIGMNWDKLRVFHAVAEAGSFTHAAGLLNLSQSAVSRQISGLEKSLQVPLFHRHARGLKLTEQGEMLYRTSRDIYAKVEMARARIGESRERPQGPLKITTSLSFGSVWLASRMKEFIRLYPDIEVSLILTDVAELDLSMREADVAIRMTPPLQADLVQRHLMGYRYHVFASTEYLKDHGMPKKPKDLDKHRIVAYGEEARPPLANLNFLLEAGLKPGSARRRAALKVNSVYGMFRAVQSGLGIAPLPEYMSHEFSSLVEVLPELRGPRFDLYFVYPEELRRSSRIEVFRDFLLRKISDGDF